MTSKHWALIAAFLAGLGLSISGLQHWTDALTPAFVGGALVQLGAVIGSIYARTPADMARRREIADLLKSHGK